MGALVLLHVVFAGEGFLAGGAEDVFLARVFLAVAGGVAGGGEGVGAVVADGVGAGVFFLRGWGFGGRGGGVAVRGGGGGGAEGGGDWGIWVGLYFRGDGWEGVGWGVG